MADCNDQNKPLQNVITKNYKKSSHSTTEAFQEASHEDIHLQYSLKRNANFAQPSLDDDLRIVVIGKPGVGKSATANTILDEECFPENTSTQANSMKPQIYTKQLFGGRTISVMDTPGVLGLERPDKEYLRNISDTIREFSEEIHVFVYVFNLACPRFTMEDKSSLDAFESEFGEQLTEKRLLVYTHAESTLGDEMNLDEFLKKQICGNSVIKEFLEHKVSDNIVAVNNKSKKSGERRRNQNVILGLVDRIVAEKRARISDQQRFLEDHIATFSCRLKRAAVKIAILTAFQMKPDISDNTDELARRAKSLLDIFYEKGGIGPNVNLQTIKQEYFENQHEFGQKFGARKRKLSEDSPLQHSPRVNFEKTYSLDENLNIKPTSQDELRIVVIGKIKVGKSATANTILGDNLFREDATSDPCTLIQHCFTGELNGRKLTVLDTPGLEGNQCYQGSLQRDLSKIMTRFSEGVHAFVYVFSMASSFFSEEDEQMYLTLQAKFGDEMKKHCLLVYSHAESRLSDEMTLDLFCKNEKRRHPFLKKFLDDLGGNIIAVNNKTQNEDEKHRNQTAIVGMVDKIIQNNDSPVYTNETFTKVQERRKFPRHPFDENTIDPILDEMDNSTNGSTPSSSLYMDFPKFEIKECLEKDGGINDNAKDTETQTEESDVTIIGHRPSIFFRQLQDFFQTASTAEKDDLD